MFVEWKGASRAVKEIATSSQQKQSKAVHSACNTAYHYFLEFFFGLIHSSDICKGHHTRVSLPCVALLMPPADLSVLVGQLDGKTAKGGEQEASIQGVDLVFKKKKG